VISSELLKDSTKSDVQDDSIFVMKKSPWGATLRSAILPGWGQFYNESYLKIPIVWGVMGWFIYNYLEGDKEYRKYKDLFLENGEESSRLLREFYRDERDLFAIYTVLAYIANLIDAYVDAHLFDFSVNEDLISKNYQLNMKFYFGRFGK